MAASSRVLSANTKNRRGGALPKVRYFFAALLITLASAGIAVFVAASWAKSQLLDTDNWVSFVTPLPKVPAVANAMADFVTSNVLETQRVESRIRETLPERGGFLAPVLAEQLQARAKKVTEGIVVSDTFEAIWIGANQSAHRRLMDRAHTSEPETGRTNQRFDIDLQAVRTVAAARLDPEAEVLGGPAADETRPLQIAVDLKAKRQRIASVIQTIEFLQAVLPAMVIAGLVWGCVWFNDRRRPVIAVGLVTSLLLLTELIAIKAQRQALLGSIGNESYRSAAAAVYDSLVSSLSQSVLMWFLLAVLVTVVALLAGSGVYGLRLRSLLRTEAIFSSAWYEQWRLFRLWLADQKYYFWTIILMAALFYLAFVININKQVAVNTLFSIIAAIGFVQLLATPPYLINGRHEDSTGSRRKASRAH